MKLQKRGLLVSVLALFSAFPVAAQVEKVAMRTTGISCGLCAGLSELSFRRMPGVDRVAISLSKEAIMLTYKQGASFDPEGIRKILARLQVGVTQFQISAKGHLEAEGERTLFIAGRNKFAIKELPHTAIPQGAPILIQGILNDHANPMELRILDFKPLGK
ncbi:MAG TPA: hypothetical protein VFW83_07795 [Bryobacteraceae bacterium]|nr:hypothetical protein [Bryobacteraceae bacterium]